MKIKTYKYLFIFLLAQSLACSNSGSSDASTNTLLTDDNYYGEYSGSSFDFDSIAPCPNNTAIVTFELIKNESDSTMEIIKVGSLNDLVLTLTKEENTGGAIQIEASGTNAGYNVTVVGEIAVYNPDPGFADDSLRFTGTFSAQQGSTQCGFEYSGDYRSD